MRVCILGAGISSLTLAKALVNQNIYVDVFSLQKNLKPDPSRTLGISKSNTDFFKKYIIDIEKIIWKIKKIEIFTDNLKNEKLINFENNIELFSIVKNSQLFELLKKSLSKSKYFKIINLKNSKLLEKYELVINTEFSNFFTKKFFNKKIIKKYKSTAYTTVIKHSKINNKIASQIFTKKGPLAFLPISSYETSVVYSFSGEKNQKNDSIFKLIHKYNLKYKIEKIDKIKSFKLISINLRSYYNGNILAFGDLLHRIHPLAGQGFNMTIRDIKILLKIIKTKKELGLLLDSSINSEFEKKIKHKNFIFSQGVDFIHEFFNFERKFSNNILSKSVQILGKNNSINNFFKKVADQGILA